MREAPIEAKLVAAAEADGWQTIKIAKSEARGRPDRMFFRQRVVKFLEVKRPGEAPSRQQERRIQELRDEGFAASWCDNVEDGLAFLRKP